MISLRLPPELERKLDSFAKSEGKSRTEIVKDSILEYINNRGIKKTPFELGLDLFGKHNSDITDLAQNRKSYLHKAIGMKNEKRSSH
ncbi:ribbon-helix-helix protein, CopG family [Leptospira bandrabouensis]|uniref:ribbon-helix-helix protein, CopG family n=1 Tax=Leptospira bandrabouensis TaxID=2484903 RepID=UPI001EE92D37|nr:ribbon-helix-helix protein, CopG family [Leptospira bandrabouensis]MCG6144519.1 ribbon-helix-helix protein, CopG family [Leptospira bandrabouensis]MCG6160180.1 ribbon-helix-helix protein, CopG family [Leptospira bandrabouensis]MCG6164113.1 ribbon-helix-helix protein, CopG family [Leptospira bandrabouensis]